MILKIKKSTNNKIHLIINGYYACNKAIGKHKKGIINSNFNLITCKNCLRKNDT